MPAAPTEITSINPMESVIDVIGNSGIIGSILTIQRLAPEQNEESITLMGSITHNSEEVVDSIISKINVDKSSTKTDTIVVHNPGLDGLATTKSKSTWVRLIRMDCGPGGTTRAPSTLTLRKRELTQCPYEENDEYSTKRGKVEGTTTISNEILAGVESHHYQKQCDS